MNFRNKKKAQVWEKKYLLGVIIVYKICFNIRNEKQKERAKTMKIKTKEMYLLAKIKVFFRRKLSQKEGFIFLFTIRQLCI